MSSPMTDTPSHPFAPGSDHFPLTGAACKVLLTLVPILCVSIAMGGWRLWSLHGSGPDVRGAGIVAIALAGLITTAIALLLVRLRHQRLMLDTKILCLTLLVAVSAWQSNLERLADTVRADKMAIRKQLLEARETMMAACATHGAEAVFDLSGKMICVPTVR